MNSRTTIYQTLEHRNNADEVEASGPFLCHRKNAWLGVGYYFWDTDIELAHEWGRNSYNGNYFICRTYLPSTGNDVFDLVGNLEHLKELREAMSVICKNYEDCTVATVIEYLKKHTEFLKDFKAVRSRDERRSSCFLPYPGGKAILNLRPRIQICVFNKSSLEGIPFEIIYPDDYRHFKVI